jgi:tetratricopeptide (TPR) repeat protein
MTPDTRPIALRRVVGLLTLLVLGAGPGAWAGQPAAPKPVRIAVLPFTGPDAPERYGLTLGQAVRQGFQQVRAVRLASPGEIMDGLDRLGLTPGDRMPDEALLALAKRLDVRALVTGTFEPDGEALLIKSRWADPSAGRVSAGADSRGPASGYLGAARTVVDRGLADLGVHPTELDARRLQEALSGEPRPVELYGLYAEGVWDQGLGTRAGHERAMGLLIKATESDPNFGLARVALGVSLYATNQRWKASGEFRKAIQIDGRLAEAHKLLGDMLVNSPRRLYDQAIQAYSAALAQAPDYAEARVGLGDAYQAKGQYDNAIEEYKKAAAMEPENARVHYGLGKIYYNEKGLYHEAVAEYQKAATLDPRLLDVQLSLAELYDEKGLYPDAVARYQYVLSIDPKHPGATYGLAQAYEHVDVPKAMQQWERYIDLAATLPSEKDWVEIARKHLDKLRRGEKPR